MFVILSYFFTKKSQCVEWCVAQTNQIATLGYISHTNQFAALWYVSCTNQIAAFDKCNCIIIYNFLVKKCFFHSFSHNVHAKQLTLYSITYYENNVQSPIRTHPIIALCEHQAIFHMLELYSTDQIPFCHIRLCSTTCHFLVNNLHLITYSNHIIQHHRKNSHRTKCY